MTGKLIDRFGRVINYLRISVTDRCNFRCVYCMEEKMQFVPRTQLLTLEELYTVARAFTELGVSKIRITGGEPLVRRNILHLFGRLGQLAGLKELVVTTNGSRLVEMGASLERAGVRRINISLDSLDPGRFKRMTRTGDLDTVLKGIDRARQLNFQRIKINTVILKDRNHDEVTRLVDFAIKKNIDISFIEEMPLGVNHDHDRAALFYSSDMIKADLENRFTLHPTIETTGGPARYFKVANTSIRVGFISPHSHNFCAQCNRVRLTCEGRLLLCLGQEHSVDLREIIRTYPGEMERLKTAIRDAMAIKPKGHEFDLSAKPVLFRHMNATGG